MAMVTFTFELELQVPAKSSVVLPTPPSNSISSHRLLPSPITETSAAPALKLARRHRVALGREKLTDVREAPVLSSRPLTRSPPNSTCASAAPRLRSSDKSARGERATLATC